MLLKVLVTFFEKVVCYYLLATIFFGLYKLLRVSV